MTALDALETRERSGTRQAPSPAVVEVAHPLPTVAQPARRRKRGESRWAAVLPPLVIGLLLLGFWEMLVRRGTVAEYLLPPPADVADRFWNATTDGLLLRYAWTTLKESLLGFAAGAAVALPIGYGIARSAWLARALEPYLAASQAIPAVALAPLLVIWLGYGLTSVVVLCALIVFFPAVVNTALGIRTLDREVLDAARVDGAGGLPLLLHFELPLALPAILAGLRTSLTLSVTGAVVGEFVLGDQGLGGLQTIARGNFDTPLVFATLVMLMLLASALYGVARLIERALIRLL
jgi:NitT/TauT family transport system permease protein